VAKILCCGRQQQHTKDVGLALKDQGIDVVAVGNGEAAVRKISDIRPDLVLADGVCPCERVRGLQVRKRRSHPGTHSGIFAGGSV